uniref:Uncharacterized protein n=1 Tax=Cryptomonas curvata TaxID=233186 RepID=A0A6T7VHT3_9CRYP
MAVLIGNVECFRSAGNLGLRTVGNSRLCPQIRRSVGVFQNLKSQIISNPNEGWKADHQKAAEKSAAWAASGNVDTPDYFEDDGKENTGDLGFKSGAAATGGDGGNKLKSMLSADKTEIRTVEKLKYQVEFKPHKWRIDGDFAKDPSYALVLNTAEGRVSKKISVAPNSMTFEDFVAGFSPDSSPGWEVTPREGQLDRKGGKVQEFEVTYRHPSMADKADQLGTLVIVLPNDNWSWTYKFKVTVP